MLDLVQQVRSGDTLGGKPAPTAIQAALATLAESATSSPIPAMAAPSQPVPSQPAPTRESPPQQPATALTPATTQAAAIAAATAHQQAPTMTKVADQAPVASTPAHARDDEEGVTDSAAPAATPLPDAVTMALLASTQIQTVARQAPASSSDRPADVGSLDADSLTAPTSPAGDDEASTAALLAAQPGQEAVVAASQDAATRKVATQATAAAAEPLKPEPADTQPEDRTAARFETHIAAQAERTASAEQPAANLPTTSSTQVSASLAPTGTASHATAPVQHQILTGFGNRGWDQAVSQRVLWLAQDQLQQASLTLNPPHLGPVQVTVQIDNQQAMVQFVSNQPEVRQALQDALPVLREMFGQAGIALGQADVSSRNPEQGQTRQSSGGKPGASDEPDLALDGFAAVLPRAAGQGLINLFA